MAGYTRQDTTNNIADGNVINAADFDNEYDAIAAAFHKTTGHSHDGTDAEGAAITKVGPSQDVVVSSTAVTPKTDNTVDLGSSLLEFKDLYIDGVANIDSLVADTADINAGTVDNVVIGGATAAAGTFTTLTSTGTTTLNGTTIPASTTLLSTDGTQTLTNKTISADSNTISGIAASSFVLSNSSGNIDGSASQKAIPTGTVVGTSDTQTLTNKTINGTSNTITNVSLTAGVTGTLPVSNGGTGATSLSANAVLLGNGTSSVNTVAPGTSGNVLTSNGTTWVSQSPSSSLLGITQTILQSPYETSYGYEAGESNTGNFNTLIGLRAGYSNTSGSSNSALGFYSLYSNTTGYNNTSTGESSLYSNTSGYNNVAVGESAAFNNTTGYQNIAIGVDAFSNNTTGYQNTTIGFSAGSAITTGNNLTCVGHNAQASSSSATNQITLGNSSVATLRCQVTTITSLSDARDKTNVNDLPAGLDFINALRPVEFDWNMRDGGKVGEHDTGFIAQDLKAAQEAVGVYIPGLVYDDNPEKLEAGYGKLIPVLVKAVQELSAEIERLKGA